MNLFWLSLIQGITEFLPVSSSGHIFIFSALFYLKDGGRLTEVLLNLATLFVVLFYFRTEVKDLFLAVLDSFKGIISSKFHQGLKICVATLPVVMIGFLVHSYMDHLTHSFRLFGIISILLGGLMILADWFGKTSVSYDRITYKKAFLIGLIQAGAFIPGASRLGLSLTAARVLGLKRYDAAKFSFLTSIPIGIGAFVLLFKAAMENTVFYFGINFFIILFTCFFVGYVTLYLFMKWVRQNSLLVFGVYRILLGIFVLIYFYA